MVACWCGSGQQMGNCNADHEAAGEKLQDAGYVPKDGDDPASTSDGTDEG